MRILLIMIFLLLFSVNAEEKKPNILLILADNWAWPHASAYGNKNVKTPNFDAVAKSGTLFTHGFCQVPSCSPARAVLLTGRAMHQLGPGANLWGDFPDNVKVFPEVLSKNGYNIGYQTKGWGPGLYKGQHYKKLNPCGVRYKSFEDFLKKHEKSSKPFFFWYGSHEPHMPWNKPSNYTKVTPGKLTVPPYLPNNNIVQNDLAGYYTEIQNFDEQIGKLKAILKKKNLLENTILIVMGDNGWQMPRGLAQIYDSGTRVCMAISWPKKFQKDKICDELISFEDFAPTILKLAGVKELPKTTGLSLLPILKEGKKLNRKHIYLERERHANVRAGDLSYPARAIRSKDYLFIINFTPERWPGGDPKEYFAVGPYGDVDQSPTKIHFITNQKTLYFNLAFGKRPRLELYDLKKDPYQLKNIADTRSDLCAKFEVQLLNWMKKTNDPILKDKDYFTKFKYYGKRPKDKRKK